MNEITRRVVTMASAAAMLAGSGAVPAFADPISVNPLTRGGYTPVINEVCTGNSGGNGNTTSATDNKDKYCDWIEIYNPGSEEMSLSGWKLIKDDTTEYAFGDLSIAAESTLLVYSCKNFAGDESLPNTGFNLSGNGVKLALKYNDSEAAVSTVEVPALADDVTWARKPDGSDNFTMLFPTPGASNNEAESAVPCNAPLLNIDSGMYTDPFDLTMSTDDGNTIYYTTDGTDPATSDTRIEYTEAVRIKNRSGENYLLAGMVAVSQLTPWGGSLPSQSAVDKGTVIRAVTYSAAGEYSETVTKSYFVGTSSAKHNNLPIISVTTDPSNLFDYEKGILVRGKVYDDNKAAYAGEDEGNKPANYNQRGKEWERPCHIDFFEPDGTLGISQDCGMRTQGAYSRSAYQKSLRFYARDEYGEKNFKYPFFDNAYQENGSGKQLKKFKKIVARAGGNDIDYTKYKDSYIQSLVSDRAIDTQEGRPCVMFIDGEYWGLYTLQEDYDDHYYEENYDVNADEVMVYKKGEMDEGLDTDIEYFRQMRTYAVNHDLSKQEYYDKMCEMIDVQSFIDYMAVEIYIINEDWPGNNYSLWRTRSIDENNPYADGRWRFNLYDTEMGVYHYGNASTKYSYNNLSGIMKNKWDDMPVIFNAMLKNEGFKAQFVNTFMDLTAKNFDPDTAREKETAFRNAYYPELTRCFNRYPNWANVNNATLPCINRMHEFLDNRPSYVPKMLSTSLGLPTAVKVNIDTINPEGGSIRLNTIDVDTSKKFSGSYFPGTDITITATPADGYTFIGWRGTYSSDEQSITVDPAKATALQAVFVRDGEQNSLCKVTFTDGSKNVELYTKKGGSVPFPEDVFAKEGYTVAPEKTASNVNSDMTIKVKYSGVKYKIRFISNGSKEASYSQDMVYGTPAALTAVQFKREGYRFVGWARRSTATVPDYTDKQKVSDLASAEGATVSLYAIWSLDIETCSVSGISDRYTYSGKAVTPAPSITAPDGTQLTEGTDYTLSYKNNTACGTATLTVTGAGSYAGTLTFNYKIVPGKVNITKVSRGKTSVKFTWNKAPGAVKYRIYRKSGSSFKKIADVKGTSFKDKKLKTGTVYRYKIAAIGGGQTGDKSNIVTATKTKAPVLAAQSVKKGQVKLSWKKVTRADGYQIAMSSKKASGYKSVKSLNAKKTSFTKKSLKSGKTYYFKVRTFKKVDGKKLYSGYSKPVKVKVK